MARRYGRARRGERVRDSAPELYGSHTSIIDAMGLRGLMTTLAVEGAVGLVPSERSSGERQQRSHISKAGPRRARHTLVEAAWTILRRRSPVNAALHDQASGIAARRGSRVSVVALARKLAGLLYAMWRDGASFGARAPMAGGCRRRSRLSLVTGSQ